MVTAKSPINVFEFEEMARSHLSKTDYDYVAGGATDELTLQRTRRAYDAIALRPRILRDVSRLDLSTTVLGQELRFPVVLAPAGGHKRVHPDGELAAARAAAASGTILALSAHSSHSVEEVASIGAGTLWFQMYLFRDRELTRSWAHRAEEAGCRALCITVDSHSPSKRERDIRNNYYSGQSDLGPNYVNLSTDQAPSSSENMGKVVPQRSGRLLVDPGATWKDIDWLRSQTALPIVVKGLMTREDASLAVKHGVEGIIVSNHGARNLDTTLSTIEVLPEIVEAVEGRTEVLLDGGIRRGSDVVKALALGAKAVLIGRPIFWGLAVGGEAGLCLLLAILREEIEITMAQCGRPTIASIDSTLVTQAPPL